MSFSQQISHDKSFHLAPKSKNCQCATFQCYAERSRYVQYGKSERPTFSGKTQQQLMSKVTCQLICGCTVSGP